MKFPAATRLEEVVLEANMQITFVKVIKKTSTYPAKASPVSHFIHIKNTGWPL